MNENLIISFNTLIIKKNDYVFKLIYKFEFNYQYSNNFLKKIFEY